MEFLDERAVPALVHPVAPKQSPDPIGLPASVLEFPFDTTRAVANLLFSGTLERYPRLTILFTHAGGTLPVLARRLAFTATIDPTLKERQPADIPALIRRLYFDLTMSANAVQLSALKSLVPPENILFGSDFPFMPASHTSENLGGLHDFADLSEAERHLVTHANAARLFPGLTSECFTTALP
jgi:predicted TIM-barrel fold metal-dependent hydrolase